MNKERNYCFLFGALKLLAASVVVLLSLSQQMALAQAQSGTVIHIVGWGETVSSIAAKYGVTADDIVAYNQLPDSNRIYAGQQLIIPVVLGGDSLPDQEGTFHIVQTGENLYRISLKYGVSIHALMSANGLDNKDRVYIGQSLIIPQAGNAAANEAVTTPDTGLSNYHVVQPGETLSGVSQKYNVSMSALQAANKLINPSLLFIGQRLIIPGAANATNPGYTAMQAAVTHIVRPGENLFAIAAQYGVSMWVIAQTNNISNPSLIYPGQSLSIPKGDSLTLEPEVRTTPTRSIVVDISEQRTYVYENGVILQVFVVSTGVPGQDTMRGSFFIQNKIPVAYATTWDLQMPYWLGFYWAGSLQNGFHALPILSNGSRLWEGLLGRPASYGCVILSEEAAQWLYGWAEIGTPVVVQD